MLQDLKYTLRALRHQPAFAAIAILTLAVGIGATTAIFTTVNAVVLRQLPFREPAGLYAIRTELSDGRITNGAVSPKELAELNKMTNLVESATGALRYEGSIVDRDGNPIRVVLQGVAPKFVQTFGVPVAAGRDFTEQELGPDGPFAMMISYRAWQTHFAGDPKILGQSVTMEGGPVTLVGVAGQGFNFPGGADGWFTIKFPDTNVNHAYDGFLRTRPGVTIDQLRAAIQPLAMSLQKEFPGANGGRVFVVAPLLEAVVGPLGPTLMVVMAASGLLLLVACVNVTSLMLSRGVVRAREVALRIALGAGRFQVLRQLFIESLVLGLAGAIGGIAVAFGGLRLLVSAGAGLLPRLNDLHLDGAAMLFSLAASVLTAVLVGFAPALRLARTDVKTLVNETGRSGAAGAATHRLLHGLVVAEIALAVVLTVGAVLLVRSFSNLQRTDPGFTAQGRIVFEVSLPVFTYDNWDRIGDWYNTLIDRVRNLAGVTSVGAVSSAPLGPELDTVIAYWTGESGQIPPEQRPRARRRTVTPDFFKAAGVSLVTGRHFQESDRRDMPGVAIIDQVMARQLFGDRNPIGQRIVWRTDPKPVENPITIVRPHQAEVVGVVRSVRYASLGAQPEPTIYLPLEQIGRRQLIVVVATGLSDPLGLIASVRAVVKQADPTLSIDYYDMGRLIERSLTRQRLSMALLVLFGAAALILAAVGIYGIMAYSVAQRRGEFAVRAALGAEPGAIRSLVLARGRTLGLIGVGTGLVIAAITGRFVESQLFGVSALDPIVLALMALTMLAIVFASTLVPAIRASRVRAASVFRGE